LESDPFTQGKTMKLRDIAVLIAAEIEGPDAGEIHRVARIEEAGDGDVTFLSSPKYARFLHSTRASAVIISKTFKVEGINALQHLPALLRVDDPYESILKVHQAFHPLRDPLAPGIHPTAVISATASLGRDARIGAYAVIGEQCHIGDETIICQGVMLGDAVEVGSKSLLYPNVTVREECKIGSRVVIHSGATVGSDGFGFTPKPDGSYEKIPQLGSVVIEDDVEIGANCTIDRATMGETRIKKGSKLDNLIQVAHNVVIGENTVIAAQAGISGSTKIGKGNMIGGQVGITGHLHIAENTRLGAQSGVHHSILQPGKAYFGSPAHPQRQAFRIQGAVSQLPDLLDTVRELKAAVERLEKEVEQLKVNRDNTVIDSSSRQ
jgi:UDP-3-O-[3-hydroxymyristoyl] glucosamine N-acyltransferase